MADEAAISALRARREQRARRREAGTEEPEARGPEDEGDEAAAAAEAVATLAPRSFRGAALGFLAMVALPTLAAAFYFFAVAADRYVVDVHYSVRGGAISLQNGEPGRVEAMAGLMFAGDSFILEDYVVSARAMTDVEAALPLREMLARDGGDPVRRFDPAVPQERLTDFWTAAVRVRFDAVTGITRLRVTMFDPDDALAVAETLVGGLRRIVDSLTEEANAEMLAYVAAEYDRTAAGLADARAAIEAFRRENRMVSPDERVEIGSTIIGTLSAQIADLHVELRTLRRDAPNSPRIRAVLSAIAAAESQLGDELVRRGGEADSTLPSQLTSFDELENDYLIARDSFIATLQLRQQAEASAALGRAQLVVHVPPLRPTISTAPDRPLEVLLVFGGALAIWVIGRIFLASLSLR